MVRVGGEGRRNRSECGYRNTHTISHFLGTKVERTTRLLSNSVLQKHVTYHLQMCGAPGPLPMVIR